MIASLTRPLTAAFLFAFSLACAEEPAAIVAPAESPLSSEQLLEALAGSLHTRFMLDGDLQIEFVGAWSPPARVAKAWRIAIVEYPSAAGASMLVRFRVFADESRLQDATVMLRASLWRDAWFAREPLPAGAALEISMLEMRRIDCFRARDAIPSGAPDSALVVTRAIQAGTALTWRDVGRRPLVRKGEMVEVSASEGMLHITMKCLALQSGAKGDLVTVRNPESLKVIPAQVVAEDRVEVRL